MEGRRLREEWKHETRGIGRHEKNWNGRRGTTETDEGGRRCEDKRTK
jgi:hypothetical protein